MSAASAAGRSEYKSGGHRPAMRAAQLFCTSRTTILTAVAWRARWRFCSRSRSSRASHNVASSPPMTVSTPPSSAPTTVAVTLSIPCNRNYRLRCDAQVGHPRETRCTPLLAPWLGVLGDSWRFLQPTAQVRGRILLQLPNFYHVPRRFICRDPVRDKRNGQPWPLVMPGHAGSTKSMPAHWTAALKLPKRRRIVFSDGLMPAWVHEAAVGEVPRSATKRRTASSAWSEARLPFKPNRRRRPSNSKVFELCMAGSTRRESNP